MKLFLIIAMVFGLVAGDAFSQFESLKRKLQEKTEETIEKSFEEEQEEKQAAEDSENNEPKAEKKSLKSYSKYDFIPGEKLVFYDDFSTTNIGDFPANWDTDATAEVVEIDGIAGKWFKLMNNGYFKPDFNAVLPENYTVEFDIIFTGEWIAEIGLNLFKKIAGEMINEWLPGSGGTFIYFGQTGCLVRNYLDDEYSAVDGSFNSDFFLENREKVINIRIWFQGKRVRVYIDEKKSIDMPRAVSMTGFDAIRFEGANFDEDRYHIYISNIRVAEALPDLRKRLETQGKIISYGIRFDSNSDIVKPESFAAMKEIAEMMKADANLKFMIVGHTDADGDDKRNLDLSKRRAENVKKVIINEFSIDGTRLQTDGKGESAPIDKNNTPEAKAKNRRVEFLKF